MLLQIDSSITNLAYTNFDEFELLLSNLKSCDTNGKHHVQSDIETLKKLHELVKDIKIKSFLANLKERYFTPILNESHVVFRVNIRYSDHVDKWITEANNTKILNMNYKVFLEVFNLDSTHLVLEDEHDLPMYLMILKYYMNKRNIRTPYVFEFIDGNGGRMHRTFKMYQENHKFYLFIAEADLRYPNAKKKSTASSLMKQELVNLLSYRYILDIMEIENLIPLDYLKREEIVERSNGGEAFIEALENSSTPHARLYFDFKKGIKKYHIKKSDFIPFWKKIIEQSPFADKLLNVTCLGCKPCKKSDCRETIVPCVCENLLKTITNEHTIENHEFETAPDYLQRYYQEIGQVLFSWLCASPKRMVY
jgi:hypothetical protein